MTTVSVNSCFLICRVSVALLCHPQAVPSSFLNFYYICCFPLNTYLNILAVNPALKTAPSAPAEDSRLAQLYPKEKHVPMYFYMQQAPIPFPSWDLSNSVKQREIIACLVFHNTLLWVQPSGAFICCDTLALLPPAQFIILSELKSVLSLLVPAWRSPYSSVFRSWTTLFSYTSKILGLLLAICFLLQGSCLPSWIPLC